MFKIGYDKKITMVQGDTGVIRMRISNYELSQGDEVRFAIVNKANPSILLCQHSDKKIVLEKQVTVFEKDGSARIVIYPYDTEYLQPGKYLYEIQVKTKDGRIDTVVPLTSFTMMDGSIQGEFGQTTPSKPEPTPSEIELRFKRLENEIIPELGNRITNVENEIDSINSSLDNIAIDISEYGAIGNGEFNNTSILNSIIEKATKNTIVKIPCGNFLIDNVSFLQKGNITLVGIDKEKTILTIKDGCTLDNINDVLIKDIQFKNLMVKSSYVNDFKMENCKVIDSKSNALFFQNATNIVIKNNEFINIGTTISDKTTFGKAIVFQADNESSPCDNILIDGNYFEEIKGNSAIYLYKNIKDYTIKNNTFKNTVWSAIMHWEFNNLGFGIIENNKIYGAGLGTPSPNDLQAKNSGIGCSAIYTDNSSSNVKVLNNRIYNVVENGIEGAYGEICNNYIYNTGVNSEVRKTPSTEGIYITSSGNGRQIINNNIILRTKLEGIKTNTTSIFDCLEITNNVISDNGGNGSININVKQIINELIISNNTISAIFIWLSTNEKIKKLIINNKCMLKTDNFINFEDGYVYLGEIDNHTLDCYFNNSNWTLSSATTNNNICNIGEWGYIQQVINKQTDTISNKAVLLNIEYISETPTSKESIRVNLGDKNVFINGSDNINKKRNILYNINDNGLKKYTIKVSNSSNFIDTSAFKPVDISFIKVTLLN